MKVSAGASRRYRLPVLLSELVHESPGGLPVSNFVLFNNYAAAIFTADAPPSARRFTGDGFRTRGDQAAAGFEVDDLQAGTPAPVL